MVAIGAEEVPVEAVEVVRCGGLWALDRLPKASEGNRFGAWLCTFRWAVRLRCRGAFEVVVGLSASRSRASR